MLNAVFATQATGLADKIASLSIRSVGWGTLILLILITIAAHAKRKQLEHIKLPIFWGCLITILAVTGILITSTIYLNVISSSRGPVHWHADIEIWNCSSQVEIADPSSRWVNKVGSATLHEHNDKRIHMEGVVVDEREASVGKFMESIGGELTHKSLVVPTSYGPRKLINGESCLGRPGEVQVYVYKTNPDKTYSQYKVDDPEYVMSPYSNVPEGDCIIVEFDKPKLTTDKLCQSYKVAVETGKLKGPSQ